LTLFTWVGKGFAAFMNQKYRIAGLFCERRPVPMTTAVVTAGAQPHHTCPCSRNAEEGTGPYTAFRRADYIQISLSEQSSFAFKEISHLSSYQVSVVHCMDFHL
jgi:hypothetical protein